MIDPKLPSRRPIPLLAIVLLTLAIHGPMLIGRLPRVSFDMPFHIFFSSHYAQHWFNPWNEKWFAGFSQTTYPPLQHQWIALFSYLFGLDMAYMLVQLVGVVLIPIGMYRFAKLWVSERAASYAAVASIFISALAFLVYYAGQLSTTLAAALYLNVLPYLYEWSRRGRGRALVKGVLLALAAAAVHHVTLIFGAAFFAIPIVALAVLDRNRGGEEQSAAAVLSRAGIFAALTGIGVGVVLLPYWIAIVQHPIVQVPIPHGSRDNFLLNPLMGFNYFVVPYATALLFLPFAIVRGARDRRLIPLVIGFWTCFLFSLGGTTPLPRLVLGRAFDILTFERFSLWALLLLLPLIGLVVMDWVDRAGRRAVIGSALAAVASLALAMGWLAVNPFRPRTGLNIDPVVSFLNRDGHDRWRYITLGFGNDLPRVSTYANASSVDGEYNSARLLPEMTSYGSAQLTSAKFYGTAGMSALRAMLQHANRYGLKYIFVADPYYEPLLVFAGWRKIETFNQGQITAWSKDDVPPAQKIPSDAIPTWWQGVMWGTLPIGSSLLAMLALLLLPERKSLAAPVPMPTPETVYAKEA